MTHARTVASVFSKVQREHVRMACALTIMAAMSTARKRTATIATESRAEAELVDLVIPNVYSTVHTTFIPRDHYRILMVPTSLVQGIRYVKYRPNIY